MIGSPALTPEGVPEMTRFPTLMLNCTIVAAGLFAVTQPSHAATTARVSYADLDLTSTADRAALDNRLRTAASKVCFAVQTRDLAEASACRTASLIQARATMRDAVRSASVQVAQR
jgi:UrcA family protein